MTPVDPNKLGDCWPWVRQGIERVIRKTKEKYLPEDVYLAIKQNRAFLYLWDDGFCVLQKQTDADGSTVVLVWILAGNLKDIQEQCFDDLAKLAKSIGATCLRWESPRNWSRFGELKRHVYERTI